MWFGTTEGGLGLSLFANLGLTHEGGTFFDGKSAGGDVTHEDGVAFQLATLSDGDIAFDFAENDDGTGFVRLPSEMTSPSILPSIMRSWENLMEPLISTSLASTFLLVVMTGAECER